MGIREWEEVPKTDKVPLVQKGKKCKWPAHVKNKLEQ